MKKVFLVSMSLFLFGLLTSCGFLSSNSNLEGSTWVAVLKSPEMNVEMKMTLSFENDTEAEMKMEMKMEGMEPMPAIIEPYTYTFDEQTVTITKKSDESDVTTLRRENDKLIAPPDSNGVEQVFKKK